MITFVFRRLSTYFCVSPNCYAISLMIRFLKTPFNPLCGEGVLSPLTHSKSTHRLVMAQPVKNGAPRGRTFERPLPTSNDTRGIEGLRTESRQGSWASIAPKGSSGRPRWSGCLQQQIQRCRMIHTGHWKQAYTLCLVFQSPRPRSHGITSKEVDERFWQAAVSSMVSTKEG